MHSTALLLQIGSEVHQALSNRQSQLAEQHRRLVSLPHRLLMTMQPNSAHSNSAHSNSAQQPPAARLHLDLRRGSAPRAKEEEEERSNVLDGGIFVFINKFHLSLIRASHNTRYQYSCFRCFCAEYWLRSLDAHAGSMTQFPALPVRVPLGLNRFCDFFENDPCVTQSSLVTSRLVLMNR